MGDHERDLARPLEEIGSLRAENKRLRELLGWVQADRDFDTARELGEASINVALRRSAGEDWASRRIRP